MKSTRVISITMTLYELAKSVFLERERLDRTGALASESATWASPLLWLRKRAEKWRSVQKSEKPCLGTGSRAKNWNPIGKPAPEIGVESTECGEQASNGWLRSRLLVAERMQVRGTRRREERWGPFGHARQSRAACLERKEQVATECC